MNLRTAVPTARTPDPPLETIPIDAPAGASDVLKEAAGKRHSSYAGSTNRLPAQSVCAPAPRREAAAAAGKPARRTGVWTRITNALRSPRRRKLDQPQYPPRRPAFMADAAMEREMHRL